MHLPGVVGRVGHLHLAGCRDCYGELDGVAVASGVVGGFGGDGPVLAAVHVLDDCDLHRRGLLILDGDLEGLVDGVGALVDVEFSLLAGSGDVEGGTDRDFDSLVGRGMGHGALADELHLATGVAAIEADAAGGERHAEVVGDGVF